MDVSKTAEGFEKEELGDKAPLGSDGDRDGDGWTPLHAAAWGGHKGTVEMLLVHCCDPLSSSLGSTGASLGLSAAAAAVAAVTAGAEEIPTEKVPESTLGILHARTRGVRFDIPVGATALDIAEMRGHSEVAQLLRKPSD